MGYYDATPYSLEAKTCPVNVITVLYNNYGKVAMNTIKRR